MFFSLRATIASTALSVLSWIGILLLFSVFSADGLSLDLSGKLLLFWLITWELGALIYSSQHRILSVSLWSVPLLLATLYLIASPNMAHNRPGGIGLFYGALLTSLSTDVLVIAAIRALLRRITDGRSRRAITIAIIGFPVIIVALLAPGYIVAGIALGGSPQQYYQHHLAYRFFQAVTFLNASDVLLLLFLSLTLFLLIAHHSFWPALQRPLYGLQRTGLTANRKMAASLGVAMIWAGFGLSPIADALRKALGM